MKKLTAILLTVILFCSIAHSASAYQLSDDINECFLNYSDCVYLTKETKAGEIKYFGERFTIKDKNGNFLSADDYICSGDTIVYFDILDIYTAVLIGDCNCDGKVTSADARIALRLASHIDRGYDYEDCCGAYDADYSQIINAADARYILRYAAGLDDFSEAEAAVKAKNDKQNSAEYKYTHDMLMVCMNPAYIDNEAAYTPEFYSDYAGKVEIWHQYSENNIWLEIYVKEESKENLDALYEDCIKNEALLCVCKNQIIHVTW